MIYITKIFHYEAAHVLLGYDGACSNIHGHSYELQVTVKGEPANDASNPKNGMVIDFGDLKKIVNDSIISEFDHAFVMNANMSQDFIEDVRKRFEKVIIVSYQPTSEMMLEDFAKRIMYKLPPGVELHRLMLRETNSSFAEWFAI